jgi:hypothetical protein
MLGHPIYRASPSVVDTRRPTRAFLVRGTTPVAPAKPRLLDQVRAALRARHYSLRTEEAHIAWITIRTC